MIYIFSGLFFGLFVPYMARRFSKFMPATPAYALYRLIKPNKISAGKNAKYYKLRTAYMFRSIMYALIGAALSSAVWLKFGEDEIWWRLGFVWSLLLLAEIDLKTFLLPDIITFPLLMCGFAFAALHSSDLSPIESSIAALTGYIIPIIAALCLLWRSHDAFGGGDIKLLAAIGAWLGVESLLYTILLSCLLFGIYSLIKRKRNGAFGPSLAAAAVIVRLIL